MPERTAVRVSSFAPFPIDVGVSLPMGNEMKIAVLGLGLMGAPVAQRLSGQGLDVVGWNRSPEKSRQLADQGLTTAGSAREAIEGSQVVVLMLSDAAAILETLFSPGTEDSIEGRVILQMGTIAPAESRDLAKRVEAAGGEYLECPVLGSLPEAREGRLILMAGGVPALFERCLPVLSALGSAPRLIGDVGRGAALKLAMNQLIAGLTSSFSLSLGLVRAEGIEVEQFMELLRGSALYAPTFDKKLANYLSHDYGKANFPLKHLLKDVRLFRTVAQDGGMDTTLIEAVEAACLRALDRGYGDQDYSALYEAFASK
jgi:3-hydroxyisobutyrate dehydrogenase